MAGLDVLLPKLPFLYQGNCTILYFGSGFCENVLKNDWNKRNESPDLVSLQALCFSFELVMNYFEQVYIYIFFVVLGFELRAYTLSHTTSLL
jgi:hypothetical protein